MGAAEGELVEPVHPVPAERGDSSGGGVTLGGCAFVTRVATTP